MIQLYRCKGPRRAYIPVPLYLPLLFVTLVFAKHSLGQI